MTRIQVAVGILVCAGPKLLIQKRRKGTDCAGKWEFPGGKIEKGESPQSALKRELKEELDITVLSVSPLIEHSQDYAHADVSLHTFIVDKWRGEPSGFEGQKIAWVTPEKARKYDLLVGAYPLLDAAERLLNSTTYT